MRTEEGKVEEEATQTILRECRKQREDRGRKAQFCEDLQTLLFSQLSLAALQESQIKIKDLQMNIICPLSLSFIKCL